VGAQCPHAYTGSRRDHHSRVPNRDLDCHCYTNSNRHQYTDQYCDRYTATHRDCYANFSTHGNLDIDTNRNKYPA
jgi:hypothetical protein